MFCKNCGAQLGEGSNICGICGTVTYEKNLSNQPPASGYGNFQQNTPGGVMPSSNMNDISPQQYSQTSENAAPVYANTPSGNTYQIPASKPPVKKKKTGIIVAVAVAITGLALLLIAGAVIGIIIYTNSGPSAITQAEDLIEEGLYDEAYEKLVGIDSPQSAAVIDFIMVEKTADAFIVAMEDMTSEFTDIAEIYLEFVDALAEYTKKFHLDIPEKTNEKYQCYLSAVTFAGNIPSDNVDYDEFSEALVDIQQVLMNKVIRNQSSQYGKTFTLNDLQNNVDISNDAKSIIEKFTPEEIIIEDEDVKKYCKTSVAADGVSACVAPGEFIATQFSIFKSTCSIEIYNEQDFIDLALDKYTSIDDLYITSPDNSYEAYISDFFSNVSDDEDIEFNKNIILTVLTTDVAYSLITGKTASNVYL